MRKCSVSTARSHASSGGWAAAAVHLASRPKVRARYSRTLNTCCKQPRYNSEGAEGKQTTNYRRNRFGYRRTRARRTKHGGTSPRQAGCFRLTGRACCRVQFLRFGSGAPQMHSEHAGQESRARASRLSARGRDFVELFSTTDCHGARKGGRADGYQDVRKTPPGRHPAAGEGTGRGCCVHGPR